MICEAPHTTRTAPGSNRALTPARPTRPASGRAAVGKPHPYGRAVYLRHALIHPYNLPLLVLALAAGLISANSVLVMLALASELVVLAVLPALPLFRRRVEEDMEQIESAEAAKARAQVLLQMDAIHREELERLEAVVDRIRENVRRSGASAELLVDNCLGLDRLTKTYVCLAIAHRANKESLMSTNRQSLADRIQSLEAVEASKLVSERVRRLVRRRLAIAHRRAERWDRTQDELDAICHQLATVSELIHLVHEQSVNPSDPRDMSDVVDQFVTELDEAEGTLRELTAFGIADSVDMSLLEKGRGRLEVVGLR